MFLSMLNLLNLISKILKTTKLIKYIIKRPCCKKFTTSKIKNKKSTDLFQNKIFQKIVHKNFSVRKHIIININNNKKHEMVAKDLFTYYPHPFILQENNFYIYNDCAVNLVNKCIFFVKGHNVVTHSTSSLAPQGLPNRCYNSIIISSKTFN